MARTILIDIHTVLNASGIDKLLTQLKDLKAVTDSFNKASTKQTGADAKTAAGSFDKLAESMTRATQAATNFQHAGVGSAAVLQVITANATQARASLTNISTALRQATSAMSGMGNAQKSSATSTTSGIQALLKGIQASIQPLMNLFKNLQGIATTFANQVKAAFTSAASSARSFVSSAASVFSRLRSTLDSTGKFFTKFSGGITKDLSNAERAMQKFYNAGWSLLTAGYTTQNFGQNIFGGLNGMLQQYMGYEQALTRTAISAGVNADTGEVNVRPGLIQDLIFDLQRGTYGAPVKQFSQQDLAQGLYYYTSAIGKEVTEDNAKQVGTAVNAIMQMASATQTSLETATKGVINVAMEFGIDPTKDENANDIKLIAAQMGYLANATTLEVPDIAETFKMVGPLAHMLSPDGKGEGLFETMALTAMASDLGLRGGNTGRGINQALSSLLAPTDKMLEIAANHWGAEFGEATQENWKKFFFDENGNLAGGLTGFIDKLSEIPEKDAAQVLADMFTTNATRVLLTMRDAGGMKEWIRKLASQGPLNWLEGATAATNDTLSAAFKDMTNAWEELKTRIIDGISGPLKSAFSMFANLFRAIADIFKNNPWLDKFIAGLIALVATISTVVGTLFMFGGSILLIIKAFSMLGGMLHPAIVLFATLAKSLLVLSPLFLALGIAATALAVAWQEDFMGVRTAISGLLSGAGDIAKIQNVLNGLTNAIQLVMTAWMQFVRTIIIGIEGPVTAIGTLLRGVFGDALGNYFLAALIKLSGALENTRQNVRDFFSDLRNGTSALRSVGDVFRGFLETLFLGDMTEASRKGADLFGKLFGFENFADRLDKAARSFDGWLDHLASIAVVYVGTLIGIFEQLGNSLGRIFTFDNVINTLRNFLTGFAAGFAAAIAGVLKGVDLLVDSLLKLRDIGKDIGTWFTSMTGIQVTIDHLIVAFGALIGLLAGTKFMAGLLPFKLFIGTLGKIMPILSIIIGGVTAFASAFGLLLGPIVLVAGALLKMQYDVNGLNGVLNGLANIAIGFVGALIAIYNAAVSVAAPIIGFATALLGAIDAMSTFRAIGMLLAGVFTLLATGAIVSAIASVSKFTLSIITMSAQITMSAVRAIISLSTTLFSFASSALAAAVLGIAELIVSFVGLSAAAVAPIAAFMLLALGIGAVVFAMTGGFAALANIIDQWFGLAAPVMSNIIQIWVSDAKTGMALLGVTLSVGFAAALASMVAKGPELLGKAGAGILRGAGWILSAGGTQDNPLSDLINNAGDATEFLGNINSGAMQVGIEGLQGDIMGMLNFATGVMAQDAADQAEAAGKSSNIGERFIQGVTETLGDSGVGKAWQAVLDAIGLDPNNPDFKAIDWKGLIGLDALDQLSQSDTLDFLPKELQTFVKDLNAYQDYIELVNRLGSREMANRIYQANDMPIPKEPDLSDYFEGIQDQVQEGADDTKKAIEAMKSQLSEALKNADLGDVMHGIFGADLQNGRPKFTVAEGIVQYGQQIMENLGENAPWMNLTELIADAAGTGTLDGNMLGQNIHEALRPALEIVSQQTGIAIDDMLKGIPKFFAPEEYVPMAQGELAKGINQLAKNLGPELFQTLDTLGAGEYTDYGLEWQDLMNYGIGQAIAGQSWNLADYLSESWGMSVDEAEQYLIDHGIDPNVVNNGWFNDTKLLADSLGGQVNVLTDDWMTYLAGMTNNFTDKTIEITQEAFDALPDAVKIGFSNLGYSFVIGGQQTTEQAQTAAQNIVDGFRDQWGHGKGGFSAVTGEVVDGMILVQNALGEQIWVPAPDYQAYKDAIKELEELKTRAQNALDWGGGKGESVDAEGNAQAAKGGSTGGKQIGFNLDVYGDLGSEGGTGQQVTLGNFLPPVDGLLPDANGYGQAIVAEIYKGMSTVQLPDSVSASFIASFTTIAENVGTLFSNELSKAIQKAFTMPSTTNGSADPAMSSFGTVSGPFDAAFKGYATSAATAFGTQLATDLPTQMHSFSPGFGRGQASGGGGPWDENFKAYATSAAEAFGAQLSTDIPTALSGVLTTMTNLGMSWGAAAAAAFSSAYSMGTSTGTGRENNSQDPAAPAASAPTGPSIVLNTTGFDTAYASIKTKIDDLNAASIKIPVYLDGTMSGGYNESSAVLDTNLESYQAEKINIPVYLDLTQYYTSAGKLNLDVAALNLNVVTIPAFLQTEGFWLPHDAVLGAIQTLNASIAAPQVFLQTESFWPTYNSILNSVAELDGKVATVTVNVAQNGAVPQGLATGGVVDSAFQVLNEFSPKDRMGELAMLPMGTHVFNQDETAAIMRANAPQYFSFATSQVVDSDRDTSQQKPPITINVDNINISKEVDVDNVLERFDRLTGHQMELTRRGMGSFDGLLTV